MHAWRSGGRRCPTSFSSSSLLPSRERPKKRGGGPKKIEMTDGPIIPKRGKKQCMYMYVRKDGFVGNGGKQTGKRKKFGSYGEKKKVMAKSHIVRIYIFVEGKLSDVYSSEGQNGNEELRNIFLDHGWNACMRAVLLFHDRRVCRRRREFSWYTTATAAKFAHATASSDTGCI